MKAALYLRVSTTDKGQETDNQLLQLQDFCARQGWQICATYIDRDSGRKGKRERGDFSRMFDDAAKRRFDLLVFWSLDRFSREGIRKTIAYLQQLGNLGCRFKSYTEPLLDTENELVAHIVVGVLSYLAQQEAIRISERTKAGLQRARAQGKTLGRPDSFEQWKDQLVRMRTAGYSQGKISRETGLSYNTIRTYLSRLSDETASVSLENLTTR
ncbi:recombinase family protein [Trichocoleus sp. FACHB-591]|uniref:recombinase family protein n=1 Tax=Trichocoleus sp. FACHB-591 TaxID=2692872 RepID=UPI001689B333|nr:recombinase family protein [Trichocoleus sp. FACHB-591]MBD2093652.1 recombinase family protein [Trichocoleus sp. FACHB-591]